MAARIVSIGEALIDFTPDVTASGAACFVPHPGGSPFNVAKAAALAGAPSAFAGALSRDFMGAMLDADLAAAGADPSPAARSDRPTATAFVDLSTGTPRYAFHMDGTADVDMAPQNALVPGDVAHVGSIALAGVAADRIADAVTAPREGLLSVDPNVRPDLMARDPGWPARIARLIAAAAVVKLSDEDLDVLAPGATPDDFAARTLDGGTRLVVVTRGADGLVGWTRADRVAVPAPAVGVVDAVGAGDTAMGVLLAAILESGLPEDAAALERHLTRAATAAAINCTRAGCRPPTRAELDAALRAST